MGLLNHIESCAEEIGADAETRIRIWKNYLDTYIKKHDLAVGLLKSTDPIKLANDIELLIPKELVDIEMEEKNEKEILRDLRKITSKKWFSEFFHLKEVFLEEKEVKSIYAIFKKISDVLKAELHTIKLIRQNPDKINDYLGHLYRLIVVIEFELTSLFRHTIFRHGVSENILKIRELVLKIIRGEHIAQEIESEEEQTFKKFRKIMGEESHHELRQLAHDIFNELFEQVDFGSDTSAGEKLRKLANDDALIKKIIIRNHPHYPEEKVKAIIKAFKYVFEHGNIQFE